MVLGLALPTTLGFLTIPLLGITDTAVAGRLGDPAILAGLAIGAVLFDLIFGSFNFLRASTTALVAQAWGREDHAEQEAVFWRSLATALVCGIVIVALSRPLLALGLKAMSPDTATAAATSHWFGIRVLSVPAGLANFVILGYLLQRGRVEDEVGAVERGVDGLDVGIGHNAGLDAVHVDIGLRVTHKPRVTPLVSACARRPQNQRSIGVRLSRRQCDLVPSIADLADAIRGCRKCAPVF